MLEEHWEAHPELQAVPIYQVCMFACEYVCALCLCAHVHMLSRCCVGMHVHVDGTLAWTNNCSNKT